MNEPISFQAHILPLFTEVDIDHMGRLKVRLDDYTYMSDPENDHAHARRVYETVSTGVMPPAGSGEERWSPEKVELFSRWMAGGYQP